MTTERRFVFDTNVIIRALLIRQSVARQAFDLALQQGQLLMSLATLVDVAIYLEDGGDFTDRLLELAGAAERALREIGHPLPVDIRALKSAPLGFRYHVFRGQLLLGDLREFMDASGGLLL